jgi:hypothetical protein
MCFMTLIFYKTSNIIAKSYVDVRVKLSFTKLVFVTEAIECIMQVSEVWKALLKLLRREVFHVSKLHKYSYLCECLASDVEFS